MTFEKCPGCGHNYGRPMSSIPNEHGYCHWCRSEGVYDAASKQKVDQYWQDYHAEKERKEREERWRREDEDNAHWRFIQGD